MSDLSTTRARAHVGFILTNPYQLFHYGPIRQHLDCDVSVFAEVRGNDFGLTRSLIEKHLGPCHVSWVASDDLQSIDGKVDVLVCQTPVPVLKFFEKSLVVAQQYSLAKERYQYGIWRSQADLNLMYGNYSLARSAPLCQAIAVGNPLFDGHVPTDELPALRDTPATLRVLFMPTYGDLADPEPVIRELLKHDVDLTIKAHHADFRIVKYATEHNLPLFLSDTSPLDLIKQADLVVSDYSGAIYDALAMRTPVAITGVAPSPSRDSRRLSDDDMSRSNVTDLASIWNLSESIHHVHSSSREKLASDAGYADFLDHFYVNFGDAARACAEAVMELLTHGPEQNFAAQQVREATREYVAENRRLRARLDDAERAGGRQGLLGGRRSRNPLLVARKTASYVLRTLPAGDRVLKTARVAWGRFGRGAGVAAAPGPAPSTPDTASARLSPLAHVRRLEMMELVGRALDAGGVDYRTSASREWAYIAVRAEDLDSLHRVLRTSSFGDDLHPVLWLGAGANYDNVRPADSVGRGDLVTSESLVVGVPYTNGGYTVERSGGVEILLVERRGSRLVSRRKRADKTDWTSDFARAHSAPGSEESAGELRRVTDTIGSDECVDLVYTWVDSSDPEWVRERARWSGQTEVVMASAANDERYLDREELKYSLRSVMMYAPFVRNIYIVTHGHRPSWLAQDDERIRVVPHSEIFPDPDVLPTFNSHAIEACLHRIPGLAENFLYLNDDFFLGRDVRFSDFYTTAGLIKSRLSPTDFVAKEEPDPDAIPTDWASYNAIRLMSQEFGLEFTRKLKHAPYTMKRSLLEEMESRYPEIFAATRSARFRSHSDYAIPSMLAHYYGIATRRGVEWTDTDGSYFYADTGRWDFQGKLRRIGGQRPTFICLNATQQNDIGREAQANLLGTFLAQHYPIPSPFESADPTD